MNQHDFEKLHRLAELRDRTKNSLLSALLIASSGLLGILVSFRPGGHSAPGDTSIATCPPHYHHSLAWMGTILLISVGILCATAALYASVQSTLRLYRRQVVLIELKENFPFDEPFYEPVNPDTIFVVAEKICYISYLLALIALVVYALT